MKKSYIFLIVSFLVVANIFVISKVIGLINPQGDSQVAIEVNDDYTSIPDTLDDLSGVKADAAGDVAKILAEGKFSANDIELVAHYYMSVIYHANRYLYKDFTVIEQQLLAGDYIETDLFYLNNAYGLTRKYFESGKFRNGLPVLEEERLEFEEAISNLAKMPLPSYDVSMEDVIASDEWQNRKIAHEEAYLLFSRLEEDIRSFLLDVAPSQSSQVQMNVDRMIRDNEMRDSMEDYF